MSVVTTADGVGLHYEESGAGAAVLFVHEFGGSCRSFDAQVKAFSARYRCIAFNARGYPPSGVPAAVAAYSQDKAVDDIVAVLDHLGVAQAHLVGVSMGAASSLQFALRHPQRCLSVTLVGIGSGSDDPKSFRENSEATAKLIEAGGMAALAGQMNKNPNRRRLAENNPAEHRRFTEQLLAMSPLGHANTMRGVQGGRSPLYAHEARIAELRVPVLVVVGEEDEGCREPSDFLKRALPDASLHVFPRTGHCVNLEMPEAFNRLCLGFVDTARPAGG